MKILKQFSDLTDAERLAEKLENKGIVTHVSSKRSHSLSRHRTGSINVGVWAVLEHQYQDAYEYLHNPKHKITTGLSSEEILNLKQQSSTVSYKSLNKFIFFAFSGVLIFMLIIYLVANGGVEK